MERFEQVCCRGVFFQEGVLMFRDKVVSREVVQKFVRDNRFENFRADNC